ncbi:hypothetical protein ES332_D06G190700v1 [Gossypium tomentosum]|uniref:Uncharacterized protein n=1 Tax=Gossypium tomentosum TaxID=34277 RepID=A0A5D2KK00_GOSTO|nr:hypothetical protein ES332_D06G190700v1 [Gossypium tomentosum]
MTIRPISEPSPSFDYDGVTEDPVTGTAYGGAWRGGRTPWGCGAGSCDAKVF